MRVLHRELMTKQDGERVAIAGWLHKKRLLGGLTFLNIRDRSGLTQVVVKDKAEVEKLRGLQVGTVLHVEGSITKEPRAPGGVELHDVNLTIIVPVTEEPPIEIDKPLSHQPEHLDTLLDNRVIGLRNLQEAMIFKIRSELLRYIRDFLYKNDFVEINTPKLVAGAAEGGAEVFKLDYFGKDATLAQSPQLYKQIMVGVFERVFEIAPAFRAELSATTRHVSEVTMLDIEMGFIEDHNEVLNLVQALVYEVLNRVYQEHADELKSLKAPVLTLKTEFPRYSMAQIHELFSRETGKDTTKELDLTPEEEKWICEYARTHDGCEAIFATNLPAAKMKFYHMAEDDGQTARSADLLFRGVELSTVPQREHRHDNLLAQMKKSGIDPNSPGFSHFVTAFRHGLPPHGGCGFGIDRLTEKVIGLNNIKEAILFPRDINRLTP
ncbi:MAG TPA: aspartate--tRNA(Asn) ligase [Candidatus Saccharimonadales bacterium]|nr:aspartate--tRNA(Asn) ligase [Candidatus Saccharimonadales bacterium]